VASALSLVGEPRASDCGSSAPVDHRALQRAALRTKNERAGSRPRSRLGAVRATAVDALARIFEAAAR
jgi:hypothetical protein